MNQDTSNASATDVGTRLTIEVENIKCGGCERSIVKGLTSIDGVQDPVIDRDQQTVTVTAAPNLREAVAAKLQSMGYPERGSLEGLGAGLAQAKSFVSCAIGRLG